MSETRTSICNLCLSDMGHYRGTAGDESEEGADDDRSVCSESPGLHADYNGINNGLQLRKEKPIP